MISLNKEIQQQIIEIVLQFSQPEKIIIFGSRATGECTERSDIDIAVCGEDVTSRDIAMITFYLEEDVKIPLKFDVLHLDKLSNEKMKENILTTGEVIYERETR